MYGLRNARRVALGSLVAWHAVESVRIAPDYLAYFNELVGGPALGYRHLVDSSLDWGQDLPALKAWLDANGLQAPGHGPVFLSYFGTSHPDHYDIDAIALPGFPDRQDDVMPPVLTAGVYCISATMLQGLYVDAKPRGRRRTSGCFAPPSMIWRSSRARHGVRRCVPR
jgi:hypothetical protein